ncbi:MAG: hypothetical protein A2W33_04340 [Chloroflexi bacterium RBG_16_52_11]|nr:MAG: hypothetical protein A2W33_04340 [Chloroflexi bacterium RBG_16_52_11]
MTMTMTITKLMHTKLSIGAGIHHPEGWHTLDCDPATTPDILATIPPLPPEVLCHSWDEIKWIHGITSLYPWEAEQVLREIQGILFPGGKLVLEQPDLDLVLRHGKVEWLFGDPSHKNPLIMNKWAYSPDTLSELVRHCGFENIEILPATYHNAVRDFRIKARK